MYRFSIVSYLDEKTTQAIRGLQRELFELTGSRACLDLWTPHITVGDGFEIEDNKLPEFYADFKDALSGMGSFELHVRNFSYFENWPGASVPDKTPYVAYVDVILNENLFKMVARLREKLSSKWPKFYTQMWPYTPHITIAYRDLQKEGLYKAKEFLKKKDFDMMALIDHVAIVKESENKVWHEFKRFLL